jgi:apolipoprotein D and lipocalin family protein
MIKNQILTSTLLVSALLLGACQSTPQAPLATVPKVDLPRYMGDWYVIASIPTFIEKGAHNAIESYRLDSDGTIAVTFTFRDGAFDGKPKKYSPRGFVRDTNTNALWGMQFIWPIKAFASPMWPTTTARPLSAASSAITCGSWRARRAFPNPTISGC